MYDKDYYNKSLIDKRKQLGWSCKKLAKITKVPHSAILRMEKGIDFRKDYATTIDKTLTKAIEIVGIAIKYDEKKLLDLLSQHLKEKLPKEKPPKSSPKHERSSLVKTLREKGDIAELKFLLKATENNLIVSKRLMGLLHYDFIVDYFGELSRVQVKATDR